jgi:phage shock protein A
MSSTRTTRTSKARKSGTTRNTRSLARRIEGIDRKMQAALEKGDFDGAKQLAEEQERLLDHLMLFKGPA